MERKYTKRISALLLAAVMLTLAACSGTGTTPPDSTPDTDSTPAGAATDTGTAEPARTSGLPDTNWNGKTITFLSRGADYGAWESIDIYTEKQSAETLNDALYTRNMNVESKYNVRIAESKQKDLARTLSDYIWAGDDTYDAAVVSGWDGCSLMNSMLLVDLRTIPNLDLSHEWWDQNAAKDFAIGSKLYIAVGDLLISDKDGTWIYTFNKNMVDAFGIEYPYQMAKDGTWTYDRFYSMAKKVDDDLNGDGRMTGDADCFGISTERYDTYAAFFYSGGRIFSNRNNLGYPEYVMNEERSIDAYDQYYTIVADANTYFKSDTDGVDSGDVFKAGRALFRGTTLNNVRLRYRDFDFDYGIIVAPKYDEAQENYGHVVSIGSSASVLCVPINSRDLAFTGFMLEAMCFESTDTLLDAYINVAFNNKYVRDPESAEMIKMAIASRVYDFSVIYTGWGDCFNALYYVSALRAPNIASLYAANKDAVETQIQKTFANLMGLQESND